MAKRYHSGFYEGQDSRRKLEHEDGEMMGMSRGFSNMPQEVIMREYPKLNDYAPEHLDDTIKGIDRQEREDSKHKKGAGSEMY